MGQTVVRRLSLHVLHTALCPHGTKAWVRASSMQTTHSFPLIAACGDASAVAGTGDGDEGAGASGSIEPHAFAAAAASIVLVASAVAGASAEARRASESMRVAKAVDGTSQLSYHEVRMACPRGVRHATRCV